MTKSAGNTKQKLIDTATDLIWRESYNAVSVDEICQKSGVKKGSFYHFFKSKSHLALETMDACMEDMKDHYDDIFSPTRPPVERFSHMIAYIIEQQKEKRDELGHVCGCPLATLGSELAAQDEAFSEKITDICGKKAAYYQSALRDLVSEGAVNPDLDIETKANEIFAFIIGQLIMARISNDLSFIEANLERGLFDLIGLKNTNEQQTKLTA